MTVPKIDQRSPLKAEQGGLGEAKSVPSVDKSAKLNIETESKENVIPSVKANEKLGVDSLANDSEVPVSNKNAPLRIDTEKEPGGFSKQEKSSYLLFGLGVVVAIMLLVLVIFIYLSFLS